MKKITLLLGAILLMTACNKSPKNIFEQDWNTPYGTAPFSRITEADYVPAFEKGIALRNEAILAIVNNPDAPTFENTIAAYERSSALLDKVSGVFFNLVESNATASMQELDKVITPMVTAASDEVFLNPALFARVKAVHENAEGLTREQQMLTKKLYERFVRNGIGLDEAGRERFKQINARLAELSQRFGNNLLAENNAFKEATGITVSAYAGYMGSCADRDAREKAFKAYSSRGNHGDANDNNAIILEILRLRNEQAALLGFPNAAAYLLDNKMAAHPETVDKFLGEIMAAAMKKAREEIYDMQKVMDRDAAAGVVAKGSRIQPWDWWYYAERVRKERYDLDEDETKPYFHADSVRKGVFYAAEKLYGIHIEPAADVEVYHPSVKAYKLTDADGSLIGIFYADWYSRETKRGGAWMNNFREQYADAAGNDVRPIIVNVCNFPPATDNEPSLLTVDEVQTAFHEFGHALHGFLSKCHYAGISGTAVTRDFVEMFSQFNEHWAFQKEILDVYARHYRSGEAIPAALVEKINKALKFNAGFTAGELCAASILDMRWHELGAEELAAITDAQAVRAFETRVCQEMGLIEEIIPRYRSSYFNHIFNGGYSAGYYGYLWAEVLDQDAFEKFVQDGLFNPETARSFRETFLEKGGSEEPMTLFRAWRGAEPDPKALLRGRGLL